MNAFVNINNFVGDGIFFASDSDPEDSFIEFWMVRDLPKQRGWEGDASGNGRVVTRTFVPLEMGSMEDPVWVNMVVTNHRWIPHPGSSVNIGRRFMWEYDVSVDYAKHCVSSDVLFFGEVAFGFERPFTPLQLGMEINGNSEF
jgi:hypothetical protein